MTASVSETPALDYLRHRTKPVFFVSLSPSYVPGMEKIAPFFRFVTLRNHVAPEHAAHPANRDFISHVFTPKRLPLLLPRTPEAASNWLLSSREVQQYLREQCPDGAPQVFVPYADARTEQLCQQLGYELLMAPQQLRRRIDSKILTTQLGNEVGVPSVPNVLTRVSSYEQLQQLAAAHDLGTELVVQTAYGMAGSNTYFVASESDFAAHEQQLCDTDLKVMRRIKHRSFALECVISAQRVVPTRLCGELIGHPELTDKRGAWCGSQITPGLLNEQLLQAAYDYTVQLGTRLAAEGYRGLCGFDFLLDTDTAQLYLGEINPRFTGTAALNSVPHQLGAEIPALLLHILAYDEAAPACSATELANIWNTSSGTKTLAVLIQKNVAAKAQFVTRLPQTGVYRLDGEKLSFVRHASDGWELQPGEMFLCRMTDPGTFSDPSGIWYTVLCTEVLQQENGALTPRGATIIKLFQQEMRMRPVRRAEWFVRGIAYRLLRR